MRVGSALSDVFEANVGVVYELSEAIFGGCLMSCQRCLRLMWGWLLSCQRCLRLM